MDSKLSYPDFDKAVIETLLALDPKIDITEAEGNEDSEFSFKEESNYKTFNDRKIRGIQFKVTQEQRDGFIQTLQKKFGNKYIIYFSEQNFGYNPEEITILESFDKYDALLFEGTNGINYDVYSEDIINYLKKMEVENPFQLTGVGFDFVQGYFYNPIKNVEKLSEEMYEFCPDIVDQGTGSVEELTKELQVSNTFYFWWD